MAEVAEGICVNTCVIISEAHFAEKHPCCAGRAQTLVERTLATEVQGISPSVEAIRHHRARVVTTRAKVKARVATTSHHRARAATTRAKARPNQAMAPLTSTDQVAARV